MANSTSSSIFCFSSGGTIWAFKQSIANKTISSSSSFDILDTPQAVEIIPLKDTIICKVYYPYICLLSSKSAVNSP